MKYAELKRYLRGKGARLTAQGANHELWELGKYKTRVSRHNQEEVKPGTLRKILKDLHLK